ncbi:PRC-barrel domain protein [Desulfofundulus kuznetsovii DSM 6115]|uniref:PRC-barrel domain protein n=1 Tax=Desulfofundulus kuznetsovii (strain DSM 6115 / VKM B-1805 / 17) TaxID=760568 RepID=A0AAU8PEC3_DESK7|nr:PRC-barrel domain protein [Desulfofundulus kuznetsovii DSM 6115]
MRKSKQFIGMPVISLQEGQQIGVVRGLVVDPEKKAVAALIIEQKGWFKEQKYVPFNRVHSVGENVITVDRSSNAERGAKLPDIVKLVKDRTGITGARIVTESGTLLGQVDEYYVDLEAGDIVGLEFSGGFLDSVISGRAFLDTTFVRTIGKEVIVTSNEALANVIKIEGGLAESLRQLQKSTSQAWDTTRQKTRELGEAINRSLERVRGPRDEETTCSCHQHPGPNGEASEHPEQFPQRK